MTPREKFLAAMRFEKNVPTLKAEYGYWTTAIRRFLREGLEEVRPLPPEAKDNGSVSGGEKVGSYDRAVCDVNVRAACGLDPYPSKFPMDVSPRLPIKILEEKDGRRILRDEFGITKKEFLGSTSAPLDLDFPIKCRKDFEAYKEHYRKPITERLPKDWDELCASSIRREYAVRLGGFPFGFLGFPRHLIGTTELFMIMYDDPALVKDMNEFFLSFVMEYWDVLIRGIKPDVVLIWEDMASKTGSMISPAMFEEFMSPYYVRLIDFLKQHRISNIHVDSDGYIEDLIPLWVELGVTGLFPFERQAGNDMLRIRRNFPRLQIMGGVDKRVFIQGRSFKEIDAELTVAAALLRQGGVVPHADHHVPEDSCWTNFSYYRKRLNELIDSAALGGT